MKARRKTRNSKIIGLSKKIFSQILRGCEGALQNVWGCKMKQMQKMIMSEVIQKRWRGGKLTFFGVWKRPANGLQRYPTQQRSVFQRVVDHWWFRGKRWHCGDGDASTAAKFEEGGSSWSSWWNWRKGDEKLMDAMVDDEACYGRKKWIGGGDADQSIVKRHREIRGWRSWRKGE